MDISLDEDARLLLAEVLRQRGCGTVHTVEVKRYGKSDNMRDDSS